MNVGHTFTHRGESFEVLNIIPGGQGEAFICKAGSRQKVAKLLYPEYCSQEAKHRIEWLVKHDLRALSSSLVGPRDSIELDRRIGHITDYVPGITLEEFLHTPFEIEDAFQIIVQLARALAKLHSAGIAHCDLSTLNIKVERRGNRVLTWLIDFENCRAAGLDEPPMIGNGYSMAPETLAHERVDEYTDRYALALHTHEVLLYKSPFAGCPDIDAAKLAGRWPQDPQLGPSAAGYPSSILSKDLSAAFRKALGLDPHKRPTPGEFEQQFLKAERSIYRCLGQTCGGPVLADDTKQVCPYCGSPYPIVRLHMNGRQLSLTQSTVLTRDIIQSPQASGTHAIIIKEGPVYFVRDVSRNGTFRLTPNGWIRLPSGVPIRLQHDDLIRFADTDAKVSAA